MPELAQHIVEIQIGMFESREAGIALSSDPTRWAFGYAKLAGYLIAILLTVRFWAAHKAGEAWWSPKGVAWRVLGLAILANIAVTAAITGLEYVLADARETIKQTATAIISIATLPVLVWLIAGLVGDKQANLSQMYRTGWLAGLRIVVYSAMVLLPLMWLHGENHDWAFGASTPMVWGLMIFDSLVIGVLALAWGTALHHGYYKLDEPTDKVTH